MSAGHSRTALLGLVWAAVWVLVQGVVPLLTATQAGEAADHLKNWAVMVALATAWVSVWAVLHRMAQATGAVLTHVHATTAALAIDATLIQWGLPALWFASGWTWHGVWGASAQCLLVAVLVRHHLMQVLPGGALGPGLKRLLGAAVLVALLSVTLWHGGQRRADPDRLPYEPNVFPASIVLNPGVFTGQALDRLWPHER